MQKIGPHDMTKSHSGVLRVNYSTIQECFLLSRSKFCVILSVTQFLCLFSMKGLPVLSFMLLLCCLAAGARNTNNSPRIKYHWYWLIITHWPHQRAQNKVSKEKNYASKVGNLFSGKSVQWLGTQIKVHLVSLLYFQFWSKYRLLRCPYNATIWWA